MQELLKKLREISVQLGDWLLDSTPSNDEERGQAKKVLALINRLDRLRHELILEEFQSANLDLQEPMKELEEITKAIAQTAKNISTANNIIKLAGSTISIVAGVIGLLG